MKKGIIAGITFLGTLLLIIILTSSKSVVEASLSNLQKENRIEVKAPWGPFPGGAIYVFAEGKITGKGNLHIYSNHRRDHQVFTFENETIRVQVNEPEAWVDDLQIEWEPIQAREGEIELFIGCGDGWDELQAWTRKNL